MKMYCFVVVCGILVEIVYLGNFAKGRDLMNVNVALGIKKCLQCKLAIMDLV